MSSIDARHTLSLTVALPADDTPVGSWQIVGSVYGGELIELTPLQAYSRDGGAGMHRAGYGPAGYGDVGAAGAGMYPAGLGMAGFGVLSASARIEVADGEWNIYVRTIDAAGNATLSDPYSPNLFGVPQPPTNLRATMLEGQLRLSWTRSSDDR